MFEFIKKFVSYSVKVKHVLLVFSFLYMQAGTNAQMVDSLHNGKVSGSIWDSAHNYVLPSASVVIFDSDSVMLQYTISDKFGEFMFSGLPVDRRLHIVVSYTGYRPIKKYFTIIKLNPVFNFERINLTRSNTGELEEVVVKAIIPVRMNGDTLEFNADAFKLDKNAVVEDLLLKLPGITLWGDGTITINGKKVNSITVDGKPFFGGDAKIATQNLDKNAVDKIQVYKQENLSNAVDSTLNVNIKLKAGKRTGYFGKYSVGAGTDKTYESDLSLNRYSPKIQMGLGGNLNNVNKIAPDINTLFRNSTYKGAGTNTDYLTNFNIPGENITAALGYTLQYDFLPESDYRKKDLLKSNYFFTNNRNETDQNTIKLYTFKPDSLLIKESNPTKFKIENCHSFYADYNKKEYDYDFTANVGFRFTNDRFSNKDLGNVRNSNKDLISTSTTQNEGNTIVKAVSLSSGFDNRMKLFRRRFGGFKLNNTFEYGNKKSIRNEMTSFISMVTPSENRKFDRTYDNTAETVSNTLDLTYENLGLLLFGYRFRQTGMIMGFSNRFFYQTERINSFVHDFNAGNNHYLENEFLTNNRRYNILETTPSLDFSRRINKSSANRYTKNAVFQLRFPLNIRNEQSMSDKVFQNYARSYRNLMPEASINYKNNQFGEHLQTISLNSQNTSGYPTIYQLAPLVDSSNVYYMQLGNSALKPFRQHELNIAYKFSDEKRRNDFNFGVAGSAGRIINNIVDSNNYDASGRSITYFVNTPSHTSYFSMGGDISKSFKLKKSQFQIQLKTNSRFTCTPNYINNLLNHSKVLNTNNALSFYFDYKSLLSFKLSQNIAYQKVRQTIAQKNNLSSVTAISQASAAINIINKINIYTNAYYTYNKYGITPSVNFSIWNVAVAYRFLSSKNAELKFSALDILRQNRSITTYISNTSLTTTTSNILQQYYMLTLSFYPRKFGKNKTMDE